MNQAIPAALAVSLLSAATLAQAQAYVDRYFERYPGVRRYMDETRASARRSGFVRRRKETVGGACVQAQDQTHRGQH